MAVYVTAALLSVILAVGMNIRRAGEVNLGSPLTYVPLLPYLIVSAFRDGVGKDTVGEWSTYPRVFDLIQSGSDYRTLFDIIRIEPGYYAVNRAVVALGGGEAIVYALMSFIFLSFMYRYILEQSSRIPLSLFLLFSSDIFLFSLSGIRQAAASAIAFFALRFALNRRPILFLVSISVAASFHFSALIFLPAYWLAWRRTSAGLTIVLAAASFVLMLVPQVSRSIIGVFYGAAYFGSKWDYSNFNLVPTFSAAVVVGTALACRRQLLKLHPNGNLYINLMIGNLFLMGVSATLITPIRLYFLLIPAAFVLLPFTLDAVARRRDATALFLAALLIPCTSLQLLYEVAIGNDAYGTWDYQSTFGSAREL